jgi:nucleotide-binding universal stress UspA family protein
MSGTILCPTDGTDHGMVGVAKAAELSRLTGKPVTICVVNLAHGGARGLTINPWTPEQVKDLLGAAEAHARAAGASEVRTVELVAREAGPAILTYAEQEGADQIVMGTGDKSGVKRLVLGSVAAAVAGAAHCSVTVAR